MGIIAAVTPSQHVNRTVLRHKLSDLNIIDQTKVDIIEYHFVEHTHRITEFQPLPFLNELDHNIDLTRVA